VHEPGQEVTTVVADWPDPIEELCWSPDGAWLLFVAREPEDRVWWETPEDRRPPIRLDRLGYQEDGVGWTFNRPHQAFVVPAGGGEVRKLSVGGYDDTDVSWHPDSRGVVLVSRHQADRDRSILNEVYVQPLEAGAEPRRVTELPRSYARPRFSPDGGRIAVTATDVQLFPSTVDLAVIEVASGRVDVVSSELDRDCDPGTVSTPGPIWLDGQTLAVLVEDAGAVHAYACRLAERPRWQPLLDGDRRITALDARGDLLAFTCSSPQEPPALAVRSGDGPERTVHDPNAGIASQRDLRPLRHRRVDVGGGVTVDSWLMVPDPGRWAAPHPLLVFMQGGGTQHGPQWSHEFQLLTSAGFAVLTLNPRGCAGYGKAWERTVCAPTSATPGRGWGVDDIGDVVAVVQDTLADDDLLDAARVGVLGGSYGALVTTWLLATTDHFAAGWAERGPYNLFSLAGTNDESPWFFETYLGPRPGQDPSAYWTPSPIRVAEGITAPLMIVHSEQDRRCPIQQAEELFMALKLLDREVELVRFPGEGHGLTRTGSPVHRLQRFELLLSWFGRWLTPTPDGSGPSAG
jgi:dipeptidyl aminopeptidase/acylaminoacyl peptidase